MYQIFLTNMGYFTPFQSESREAAIEEAKRLGFESVIYLDHKPWAVWTPIGGFRQLPTI